MKLEDVRSCSKDLAFGQEGAVEIKFPKEVRSGVHGLAISGSTLVVLAQYRHRNCGQPYVGLAGLTDAGHTDYSFGECGFVMNPFGVSAMPVDVIAAAGGGFFVLAEDRSQAVAYPLLARFSSDGALDTRFGDGGIVRLVLEGLTAYDEPYGLVQQRNGKIVIAVTRFDDQVNSCGLLVRLTADGELDTGFHEGGVWHLPLCDEPNVWLEGVIELADGRVVAWGATDSAGLLLRLGRDDQLDSTFGQDGIVRVTAPRGRARVGVEFYDVVERQGGGLLVAGSTDRLPYAAVLGHITDDGKLDPVFNDGDVNLTPASPFGSRWLHCQSTPDGKSVAAGLTGIPYDAQETEFLAARFGGAGILPAHSGEGIGLQRTNITRGADVARCALALDPQRLIVGGTANTGPDDGVGHSYLLCHYI